MRESGTEPVVRVMVEAPDHDTCQKYVSEVVDVIRDRGYGADGCQITTEAAAKILAEIEKLDVFADSVRVKHCFYQLGWVGVLLLAMQS